MKPFKLFFIFFVVTQVFIAVSCTKKSSDSSPNTESLTERGKKVYMANCIACHNMNPKLDGGLGPANWGSSKELLSQKILKGEYPTGYSPKRSTKSMVPLPHLENEIDSLHAFLNSN